MQSRNNTMDWNDGVLKQDFHSLMMEMVGICTMVDTISKQPTSVELVLKIWRKKIEESQLSSRNKDLFTTMEDDTLRYSGHARIAMVSDSSHKNLNKRLQEEAITSGNYDEDQMEKLRKIQEATTHPRNNDTALFLEILEKYKDDFTKILTKMQQNVFTDFDCFLERLRNMQEQDEENQNPELYALSVNHTMDSGCNAGTIKTNFDKIKMEMDQVSELAKSISKYTKYTKRLKKMLRKELEKGEDSRHEDLYRLMEEQAMLMEEEASHPSGFAQTAIIYSLERLSKMLQEAACGGNEQQLKTVPKMQQDLESLRKRLDEAISSYYALHPNQPKKLTKMQQDVSAAFDCCLESLRSMRVVEELD